MSVQHSEARPKQVQRRPDLHWCVKGGSRDYVVTQTVVWHIGKKGSHWLLVIPIGFEFECSVPKGLEWALSPDDPHYLKASAIHDLLLELGFRRAFADSQWFEAALSDGAPVKKTWGAYSLMRARRFWRWALKLQDGQLRA